MQRHAAFGTLLAAALACSGPEPTPPETGPEFATGGGTCTAAPTLTPPAGVTVSAGATATSGLWLLKNNCAGSASGPWDFTSARTGAVASVGNPSPLFVTSIAGGGTAKITIPFTAGAVAGSGTVALSATNDGLGPLTITKSQSVTVTASSGGVPFGPADLFNASGGLRQVAPFTWTSDLVQPSTIAAQINTAHTNGIKLALVMTGGGHSRYITGSMFDYNKWKARQDSFNTSAIKTAVANGVSDGTIPFAVLMDEPNHSSWGGNVHHSTLDSMSRYVKSIFPTLKTGVDVTYTWENTTVYQSVDVITTQFTGTERSGDTTAYRTGAVSSAQNQKVALFFSINILNGGRKLMSSGCPSPETGGLGTTENGVLFGCKMTAAEVQAYGDALLKTPEACGLKMWTWDIKDTDPNGLTPTGDFMTRADNKAAFNHLAGTAAAHAARPCVKPL